MTNKIPVSSLIADFRTMLDEKWKYVASAAEHGKVDCSGAFVWAYKQNGCSIYHGSNRIARDEVDKLYPIGGVQVVPGMAAFKHRTPLDSGYALPASYKSGGSHYNGDLNDYYHIGLVDEDTARVLNAQSASTGFVASKISQNWSHVGYLKQVDYGDQGCGPGDPGHPGTPRPTGTPDNQNNDADTSATAVVTASSGSTVNLRIKPSTSAKLVERVPIGDTVTLLDGGSSGWAHVQWGKKTGYMMTQFLLSGASDGTWAAEIHDLTKAQAESIKNGYPSARIYETVG